VFEAMKKVEMKREYTSQDETPIETVKECLARIQFSPEDTVIDAGSGFNKVWFNEIPVKNKKEFEVREGNDFTKETERVDWVVGNPPFHEWLAFLFKSSEICNKGFAFLINHTRLNQLTPRRLSLLQERGWYLNRFHIIEVKKWFGRYYFLVFTKEPSAVISWNYKETKNKVPYGKKAVTQKKPTAVKPIPPAAKAAGILGVIL
jgi:hypothetical protein